MKNEKVLSGVRLAVAGITLLAVMLGAFLPKFVEIGPYTAPLIAIVLCCAVLVVLTPVIARGSGRDKLLALMLGLTSVLIITMALLSFAFIRR